MKHLLRDFRLIPVVLFATISLFARFDDDAVCALHAGLAIVEQAKNLQEQAGIVTAVQIRVGIATGLVAIGSLEALAIAGGTPNLAARIQAVARPGQVVIAPSTRPVTPLS